MLLQIGASVGLEREGLWFALEERRYTEKVLADEELTRRLDVGSVPKMFVGLAGQPLEKAEAMSVLSLTTGAPKPPSNRPCRVVDLLGCIFRPAFDYPWHGPRSNLPAVFLVVSRRTRIGYASG